MTSVNFDRAAGFYDQTRLLSAGLARVGLPALLEAAGPSGRLLEVGVGTGRIAVPLWEQNARLVGCDIARAMLGRLLTKYPGAPVALGDAHHLPFPAGRFQIVLTIHVLHLVGDWRAALREIRRVLAPGGRLAVSGHADDPGSSAYQLREFWRARVEAHGATWRRPGVQEHDELLAEAAALGGRVARRIDLPVEAPPFTLRTALDAIANRVSSDAWKIPDDVLQTSLREATAFALERFGDLDAPFDRPGAAWLDLIMFDD